MKKVLFLLILFLPFLWCKKEIPQINTTKETSTKSFFEDRENTSTGYELRGKELDSINYYRKKVGEPMIDVIVVDSINGFSQLYYQKNGFIECEVRY